MVRSDYLRMEIIDRRKMNDAYTGSGWRNSGFCRHMNWAVRKGERIYKISDRSGITVGMMR